MEEEGSSTSSGSISETELGNLRFVDIRVLNVNDAVVSSIPQRWSLVDEPAYWAVNEEIKRQIRGPNCDLMPLVPTFGPWPYWKLPTENDKIPRTTRTLYLVDQSKRFCIALLRTEKEDRPLLIELPSDDEGQQEETILSALKSTTSTEGLIIQVMKMYGSSEDIKDQRFNYSDLEALESFPTVFYILCCHSDRAFVFKKQPSIESHIPAPLQITFARCKRLAKSASRYPAMTMQCTHIYQSILHLIVSLIDTGQYQTEDISINEQIQL
ncbi:hypothetical protein CPB86DRAFT_279893 [Serendipita vermifera]|nr:hypothetical protein CPB86DRAFT_279893 [Serendipita vermifera]